MAGYCSIGSILWALDLRNDRSLSEGISSRIHSTAHRFDLKRHMSHGGCRRPFSPSRKRPRTVRDTCRYPGVRRHTRDSLSTCVSPRSWDRQLRISAAGGPSDSPRQKEPEKPRTSQATEERTRNNPMRIPGTREREREVLIRNLCSECELCTSEIPVLGGFIREFCTLQMIVFWGNFIIINLWFVKEFVFCKPCVLCDSRMYEVWILEVFSFSICDSCTNFVSWKFSFCNLWPVRGLWKPPSLVYCVLTKYYSLEVFLWFVGFCEPWTLKTYCCVLCVKFVLWKCFCDFHFNCVAIFSVFQISNFL